MPIDCQASSSYGESYRQSIRGWFDHRIRTGAITIFDNPPAIRRGVSA